MAGAPSFKHLDGLIGRDDEDLLLRNAYQRIVESPTSCEAVLVHGESGTGKTALVQQSFQSQYDDGTVISGKFDVIHSQKPYSAFVDALTQLCFAKTWNNISNQDELKAYAVNKINARDMKILSKLVPGVETRLESIFFDSESEKIDCDPSLDQLSSNDNAFAFTRFTETVRSFLFMVARFMSSPLILFLDDVQAADKESLHLISALTTQHTESCNLLLILAHRDPVDQHQRNVLSKLVSPSTDFQVTNIQLSNLDASNLNKLISKLLSRNENDTLPLSSVVAQRTGGNIYFSLQFLEMFKSEQLLKFSFAVCEWEWDLERIRAETTVTENVALLLTAKIRQLPAGTQLLLQLAACLGFYFDVVFLERLATQGNAADNASGARDLCDPSQNAPAPGLLSSQEFSSELEVALEENLIDKVGSKKFKFTHDRVLQAAYEMIPAGNDRERLHWQIGEVLWTEVRQADSQGLLSTAHTRGDWVLFAAAEQLNQGATYGMKAGELVTPLALARLNLDAGRSALEKSAFRYAAGFFNKGVELMKGMWELEYALCLELHTLSAESALVASDFLTCDQHVAEVLAKGLCLADKLPAFLVKVEALGVRGNLVEAIDESVTVLRVLGETIPRRPSLSHVLLELARAKLALRSTKISDFVSLPDMTDPLKIWATKFLQNITLYSWYGGHNESVVVSACRMVRLTAKFGVCSEGPFVLATYGMALGYLGDLIGAYEVGRVTLELSKRPHTRICYARTVAAVFSCLNYMKEPVVRNLEHYMDGYNTGMKSGEIDGAAMCLSIYGFLGIFLGKNLNVVLAEMEGFHQTYQNDMETNFSMICMLPWHQFALNMLGRSKNPLKLEGEIMREKHFTEFVRRTGNAVAKATTTIARLMLSYILCDFKAASEAVEDLDMKVVSKGTHLTTPFFMTLSALSMLASARATRKRKYLRKAQVYTRITTTFAKAGNLNIPPLLELVMAERTSLRRKCSSEEVKKAYDSALRMTSLSGFTVFEAFGSERAGEYMQSIGDTFWADTYLSRALRLYDEWGAATKVMHMMEKYSFLAESRRLSNPKSVSLSMRQRFKVSTEGRRLSAD